MRRIAILDAPSNLGLRPPTETSVPGCAKAPGALRDHDLVARLAARDAGCLTPPRYDPGDWRPGDGVCHAEQIAAYSVALADRIGSIIDAGEFPVVLGGDCSILLGSALAMHRQGEVVGGRIGLVFVDGHSDFRHPGNASYVGAAAGEDLALATGRGQADLAGIEGRRPYYRDIDVVVLGIRAQDEYRLDLQAAGIITRPVPALRVEGAARTAQWARDQLSDCAGYWVHVDVDVLDPAVMPAVDAPDPGGIAFAELELLLSGLVDTPRCLGVEITVFDPDYDPDGSYAAEIVETVVAGLAPVRMADPVPPPAVDPTAGAAPVSPSTVPVPPAAPSEATPASPSTMPPAAAAPSVSPSTVPPAAAASSVSSSTVPPAGVGSSVVSPSTVPAAGAGSPVVSPSTVPAAGAGSPALESVGPDGAPASTSQADGRPAEAVAPSARKPADAESDAGMVSAAAPAARIAAGSAARATPDTTSPPPPPMLGDSAAAEVLAAAAAAAGIRKPPAARKAPDDEPSVRPPATADPKPTGSTKTEPVGRAKAEPESRRKTGSLRRTKDEPESAAEPDTRPRGKAEPESDVRLRGRAETVPDIRPRGKAEPEPDVRPRGKVEPESDARPRGKAEPDSVLRRKAESAWMDVAADLAARRGTPAARRAAESGPVGLRRADDSGPATLRRGGDAEPAWKDDAPPSASHDSDPAAREDDQEPSGAHGNGEATAAGGVPVPTFEPFGPPAKAGPGRLRRSKKPPPGEIA